MHLSMMLSSGPFGALLAEGLKRSDLCVADVSQDGTVVHRIEVGVGSRFSRSAEAAFVLDVDGGPQQVLFGPGVVYAQEVALVLTTVADLRAAGIGEPTTQRVPLRVSFDVSFDTTAAGTALTLTYASFTSIVTDPRLAGLDAILRARLPAASQVLDLAAATRSLGAGGTAIHAGIMASEDGTAVELRVELGAAGSASHHLADWQAFYGQGPNLTVLGSDDWAMLISKDVVLAGVQSRFWDTLGQSQAFHLQGGIATTWSSAGGTPSIGVHFVGQVVKGCTCAWGKMDVDVDVDATIRLSAENGELRQQIDISHDTNDMQLLCCELTAAVAWPVFGALLVGSGDINLGEYFLGLAAGPAGVFIAAIVKASTQTVSGVNLGANCHQDGDRILCLSPLPLNSPPPSKCDLPVVDMRRLTAVRANEVGLIFAGSDDVRPLVPAKLKVDFAPWEFGMANVSCSSTSGVSAVATVTLTNEGEAVLQVCGDAPYGPNAGAYAGYLSRAYSYCPFGEAITIQVPAWATPAGTCELLILSSGGARLVDLGPVPQLTPEEQRRFEIEVLQWRAQHCFTIPDDWYNHFHRFNPHWAVDPGPLDRAGERQHYWVVAVSGLAPGDKVALVDPDDRHIVEGVADGDGGLQLSVIIPGVDPVIELAVQRIESPDGGHRVGDGPQITVRQALLIREALLELPIEPRSIAPGRFEGKPTVEVLSVSGTHAYDVSDPGRPRLVLQHAGRRQGVEDASATELDGSRRASPGRGVVRVGRVLASLEDGHLALDTIVAARTL